MKGMKFGYNDREDFDYAFSYRAGDYDSDEYDSDDEDKEYYDPEDIALRRRIQRHGKRRREEFLVFYSLMLGTLAGGLLLLIGLLARKFITKRS